MDKIFKGIGKGIGYFFAFPGLLIAIAIYSVFGLIVFVFQFFKLIILFFTGRNLFSDLPEDIELKAKLTKDEPKEEEENKEETKKEENPLSLYPSDSPVYGSGYSSPLFNKEKEVEPAPEAEPEIEVEPESENIADEIEEKMEDGLND